MQMLSCLSQQRGTGLGYLDSGKVRAQTHSCSDSPPALR